MKVIDLLNKIENGEEEPKKIKWNNTIFVLKTDALDRHLYYKKLEGTQQSLVSMLRAMNDLSDEIEIIEEDTIDMDNIEELNDTCYDINTMSDEEIEFYHNATRTRLNEVIKAIKQLNKEIKELKEKQ